MNKSLMELHPKMMDVTTCNERGSHCWIKLIMSYTYIVQLLSNFPLGDQHQTHLPPKIHSIHT